jgi:hypothetical protein
LLGPRGGVPGPKPIRLEDVGLIPKRWSPSATGKPTLVTWSKYDAGEPGRRATYFRGLNLASGDQVTAFVERQVYPLAVRDGDAWVDPLEREHEFVETLTLASNVVLQVASRTGARRVHTFSLSGIGGAIKDADEACRSSTNARD